MAELGKKHECLSCGTKFYDLGNAEIVCPKCGANQAELSAEEPSAKPKSKGKKKKKAAAPTRKAPPSEPKKKAAEDENEVDEELAFEDEDED